MQANAEGRWGMRGTRLLGAGLAGAALFILGSCAGGAKMQMENKPPTGSCETPDGFFTGVTEAWCTERHGAWTQGPALLSSLPREITVDSVPRRTTLDSVPLSAWHRVICGDTTEIEYAVGDSDWIEWKFAWLAVDTATALANWESMTYRLTFDDTVEVNIPDTLTTRTETVAVACGDSTRTGVVISRIGYMEPLAGAQRKVTTTFTFTGNVNDGWSTYAKGTSVSTVARLRPKD